MKIKDIYTHEFEIKCPRCKIRHMLTPERNLAEDNNDSEKFHCQYCYHSFFLVWEFVVSEK